MSLSARNRGFARSFGRNSSTTMLVGTVHVGFRTTALTSARTTGVGCSSSPTTTREARRTRPSSTTVSVASAALTITWRGSSVRGSHRQRSRLTATWRIWASMAPRPGRAAAGRLGVEGAERADQPRVALVGRRERLEPRRERAGLDRVHQLTDGIVPRGRGHAPVRLHGGRPEPSGSEVDRVAEEGVGQEELPLDGGQGGAGLRATPERAHAVVSGRESVIARSGERVEGQRGPGDPAGIGSPHRLEPDLAVELPQDRGPERLAVDAERVDRFERLPEVGRRRALGRVGAGTEAGEAGQRETGHGARQDAADGDRDQLSRARSSMGLPWGVARAAASHSSFRRRSSSPPTSPFSATSPSSAASQWW